MMATTHALVGAAVGTATLAFAPEMAPVAVSAGLAGGLFPDLDLYAGHRKTLHFPVYYTLAAAPVAATALLVSNPVTMALAAFLVAAALHSLMDAFGGGLELRPWRGTSDRAVYDHYNDRWIAPRRWVRYDGAPEDFALGGVAAFPVVLYVESPLREVVIGALVVSAGYALVRKRMVSMAEHLVSSAPAHVLAYVPRRFVEDLGQ